jgi:hypothetical protein
MPSAWWLQFFGLVAGFAGAVLLVVAQQPGERGSGFEREDGSVAEFVALRYPRTWWAGLVLLCVGFAIQALALFRP